MYSLRLMLAHLAEEVSCILTVEGTFQEQYINSHFSYPPKKFLDCIANHIESCINVFFIHVTLILKTKKKKKFFPARQELRHCTADQVHMSVFYKRPWI